MTNLRVACRGVAPLPGRLEPWMERLLQRPDDLASAIEVWGSPLNLIDPEPAERNARELTAVADARGVPFRIFFARKANKAISLIDRARELGLGVDVASERELRQVLDRHVKPADVIVTAAVKPQGLIELALASGVTIALDNLDEAQAVADLAGPSRPASVALRLAATVGGRIPSRFGITASDAVELASDSEGLRIAGVHFHLDGYEQRDRVEAIGQSLDLIDGLRERGHRPAFLDMGGGIPMSYLDSDAEWQEFWGAYRSGQRGERDPLTYDAHELGAVYPTRQTPVRGEWLTEVLDASLGSDSVASALRERNLELRCEPGRSLLDGCGMTVARVEFRKRRTDGVALVGLAMNRTQLRSSADDYLVDPLLVRPAGAGSPGEATDAFLVGAYCIENELLTWRKMEFSTGVAVGDLICWPNTAGYFMHILESASHQIPLAKNVVVADGRIGSLDPIDAAT